MFAGPILCFNGIHFSEDQKPHGFSTESCPGQGNKEGAGASDGRLK